MDDKHKEQSTEKHRAELESLRNEWKNADDFCTLKDLDERHQGILTRILEQYLQSLQDKLVDMNMWMASDKASEKIIEYNRGQAIKQFIEEFRKKICNSEERRSIVEQSIKPVMAKIEKLNKNSGEFSRIAGDASSENKGQRK